MNALNKNGREATRVNKVILAVILAMAVPAQAAFVYFDTANPNVLPGETISVSIFSTVFTTEIRMDRISDADFGTASNIYLNPGYYEVISEGTLVNSNGVLIEDVLTWETPVAPHVSGILFNFDYTVSEAALQGNIINIFADSSYGAINEIRCFVNEDFINLTPESLSLTVVPEPASILSLGLGLVPILRQGRYNRVKQSG